MMKTNFFRITVAVLLIAGVSPAALFAQM